MAARPPGRRFDDESSTVAASASDGADAADGEALVVRVIGEGLHAEHRVAGRAELTIGRSRGADVRIDHPSISRQHAALLVGPPLRIEDLGSANGTRVGGRLLRGGEEAEIALNEVVELGDVLVMVQALRRRARARAGPTDDAERDASPMAGLLRVAERMAAGDISVLLLGETGVGKEVMAETIHRLSPRARRPLVKLNCGAFTEALLESELFGHVKGAFTGADGNKPGLLETADRGTLLLDEVGELPPRLQVKLLRVLEERQVLAVGAVKPKRIDVRFIAATNRDLEAEIARGAFRRDLYFRLAGATLLIPPLRERLGELVPLARQILDEACARAGRTPPLLRDEAIAALKRHAWPGNIRELRNVLERALLLGGDGAVALGPEHLALPGTAELPRLSAPPLALDPERARERDRIVDALQECAGNQSRAAKRLGISRSTLVARLEEFQIPRPRR